MGDGSRCGDPRLETIVGSGADGRELCISSDRQHAVLVNLYYGGTGVYRDQTKQKTHTSTPTSRLRENHWPYVIQFDRQHGTRVSTLRPYTFYREDKTYACTSIEKYMEKKQRGLAQRKNVGMQKKIAPGYPPKSKRKTCVKQVFRDTV